MRKKEGKPGEPMFFRCTRSPQLGGDKQMRHIGQSWHQWTKVALRTIQPKKGRKKEQKRESEQHQQPTLDLFQVNTPWH